MRRKEIGTIMKSSVAALVAAMVLTTMPAQVDAAPSKSVTVSTQASLNRALKNSKVNTITIKTNQKRGFSIPKGKYTTKSIVVSAPKVSISNSGALKQMTVKDAASYVEKADNNKIVVTDKSLKLNVVKGADNSKITVGTTGAKVNVVANGNVASVAVNKKSTVAVSGSTTKSVAIISNAVGAVLKLSAKANVALKQTGTLNVYKGASLGTVTAYKSANVTVAKGGKVSTLNSTGEKASVKINTNGTVSKVLVSKKATLTVEGKTTTPVSVTSNALDAVIKLYAKSNVALKQAGTVNVYKGATVGKVTTLKNAVVNVATGAKVTTVNSQGENAVVKLNTNGTVSNLDIDKKAVVTVEGKTLTPVKVTSDAAGSVLTVAAKTNLVLNQAATVNVAAGAKVDSLTATKELKVTVAAGAQVEKITASEDAKVEVASGAQVGNITANNNVDVSVATGAEVDELVIKGTDASVNVTANGTVGAVTVDAKADINIKGETDKPVIVNANAEDTKINTEVQTEVKANANVDITLGEGAEGSKVTAAENTNSTVTNNTKEDVTVTDSTGKESTVDAGKTEETKPEPTPAPPVYNKVTGIELNETDTILPVGSKLQLTATVIPSYASNPTVTWESTNPEVAEVDANGLVTAKAISNEETNAGEVGITAKADGFTVTRIITVVPTNTVAVLSDQGGVEKAFSSDTVSEENAFLAAVEEANKIGWSIRLTLLKDINLTDGKQIIFKNNTNGITLNLNGKCITGKVGGTLVSVGLNNKVGGYDANVSSENIASYNSEKAVVTITDYNKGKKGTIMNNNTSAKVITVNYLSKLILEEGINITYPSAANDGAQSAVVIRGDESGIGATKKAASETTLLVENAIIKNTTYGISAYGPVTVTINEGIIESNTEKDKDPNYAIGGNGIHDETEDNGGTIITINGGKIDGGAYNAGIYQPQDGILNINGGTISGSSGMDIKAGTVNISGTPEIKCNNTHYKEVDALSVKDGSNAVNCAVAIVERGPGDDSASYNYGYKVKVNIKGGKFIGAVKLLKYSVANKNSYELNIECPITPEMFSVDPREEKYDENYNVQQFSGKLIVITNNSIKTTGEGVVKVLNNAKNFKYDSIGKAYKYNYKDLVISKVENSRVTLTFKYSGGTDSLKRTRTDGSNRPVGALVDDVARYLGAIYRCQTEDTKVVNSISYYDKAYMWNNSATRAGSNWELNGATLVSALFPVPTEELKDNATDEEIRNYISNLSRKITMWPIDVEIKAELVSE